MYNKVWEGVNYLSIMDMKAIWMMITIHDVINEELLIKPLEKRPGVSNEIIIYNDKENPVLSFPQVLNDYNKGISDYNIYSQLISVYITAQTHLRI